MSRCLAQSCLKRLLYAILVALLAVSAGAVAGNGEGIGGGGGTGTGDSTGGGAGSGHSTGGGSGGDTTIDCGNGIVELSEECDDGNTDNTDACTNACLAASCGDGFVHVGVEECDDGNADNQDVCTNVCLAAVCGDGFPYIGVEGCDDGNTVDLDGCSSTCVVEVITGTINVEWVAPVARTDGTPMTLSEIGGYHVYYGAGVDAYTNTVDITDGATTAVTIADVPVGNYYIVMSTYDTEGREGPVSSEVAKVVR